MANSPKGVTHAPYNPTPLVLRRGYRTAYPKLDPRRLQDPTHSEACSDSWIGAKDPLLGDQMGMQHVYMPVHTDHLEATQPTLKGLARDPSIVKQWTGSDVRGALFGRVG